MPTVDLTITISVIVALCAIVSPVLTAIINNRHQEKMRKLELQHQRCENTALHRRQIFEDYLHSAGRCINMPTSETYERYGDAYFVALLFADANTCAKMKQANDAIQAEKPEEATRILSTIAESLRGTWQTA